MDWKDLMEGRGRGPFQRHPNESDQQFRERVFKMGMTGRPNGVLTKGELELDVNMAVTKFAGTKITPQLLGMVKAEIQKVFDTYEKEDRWPAGVGKPSFDVVMERSNLGQFNFTLKFENGISTEKFFTWELPVEEKKETVSLVREDAPWFWGR
jgi:hypothetical protein